MKPELIACSEAAHKAKDAVAENDSDADRLVELGSLVECLGGMCAPHLMRRHEIAHALDDVHEAEGEQEKRGRSRSPISPRPIFGYAASPSEYDPSGNSPQQMP